MPPLGIAYLATYLKSKGKEVEVYDLNLELHQNADSASRVFWELDTINRMAPADIAHNLCRSFEKDIGLFLKRVKPFSMIAFSANNLISTTFAGIIAEKIKAADPEKIIVVGGPGCFHSWDRKSVPKDAVDFFVIGEGEEVLNELIDSCGSLPRAGLSDIKLPGVLNNNGKNEKFIPAACIRDLNTVPFPDFSEFDLAQYNPGAAYRPLPLLMSRGCINRCSYCIDWYMCANFRVRKPEDIVAEIEHHIRTYGITHIEFNDLLCNGNLRHLEKFCDLVCERKIDIRWISYAAIRRNMSDELLYKIKKSGCNSLCFGIESGSDTVLKRMNKHYCAADAADLIRRTHAAGIEVRMNIIVGFPGETEEDFRRTLEFVRQNRSYIAQVTNVSSFVLMPGSDLAVYPHRFGIRYLDENDPGSWTDELGLTQETRNQRVRKTCALLEELKIRNLIVNASPPAAGREGKTLLPAVPAAAIAGMPETGKQPAGKFARKNRLGKLLVLSLLFVLSLGGDLYLSLIKKLRGSVIFPGN